jgi:hypothetical protein
VSIVFAGVRSNLIERKGKYCWHGAELLLMGDSGRRRPGNESSSMLQ